mmetsp:Transcript_14494/g.40482  ORF Transcript_14494/g.40482 Transcript_14494/m.40482 type:complete len:516 (+) Transcript_14494:21-1568(+)
MPVAMVWLPFERHLVPVSAIIALSSCRHDRHPRAGVSWAVSRMSDVDRHAAEAHDRIQSALDGLVVALEAQEPVYMPLGNTNIPVIRHDSPKVFARACFHSLAFIGSMGAGTAVAHSSDVDLCAMFNLEAPDDISETVARQLMSNSSGYSIAKAMEERLVTFGIKISMPHHHKCRLELDFGEFSCDLSPGITHNTIPCSMICNPAKGIWRRLGSAWLLTYSLNIARTAVFNEMPVAVKDTVVLLKLWAVSVRLRETLRICRLCVEWNTGVVFEEADLRWACGWADAEFPNMNFVSIALTYLTLAVWQQSPQDSSAVVLAEDVLRVIDNSHGRLGNIQVTVVKCSADEGRASFYVLPRPSGDRPSLDNHDKLGLEDADDEAFEIAAFLEYTTYAPPYPGLLVEDSFIANDWLVLSKIIPDNIISRFAKAAVIQTDDPPGGDVKLGDLESLRSELSELRSRVHDVYRCAARLVSHMGGNLRAHPTALQEVLEGCQQAFTALSQAEHSGNLLCAVNPR